MPSLRRRTSFITRPSPTTVSQVLTEVDKARSVSTPTWRSSRRRHCSLKGAVRERRGADRPFGVYHLLYLREGDRAPLTRHSRASPPALTALIACGAVCARALRGLMEPEALQPHPHGAHTSKLAPSLRSRRARAIAARAPVAFRAFVGSRDRVAHFRSAVAVGAGRAAPGCVSCRHGRTFARL